MCRVIMEDDNDDKMEEKQAQIRLKNEELNSASFCLMKIKIFCDDVLRRSNMGFFITRYLGKYLW